MNAVRVGVGIAAACAMIAVVAAGAELLLAFGRPPQPLALGTVQWFYEAGATVDGVDRVAELRDGPNVRRAGGQFYIVHARILAPFGMRPVWNDADVEVRTFAGTGATRPEQRFAVDERAQAILDRRTHRPGRVHLVRGAQQREDLVFDLPRDVEQPAVLFLPANDPWGVLDIVAGGFWQPHRFNIRYD